MHTQSLISHHCNFRNQLTSCVCFSAYKLCSFYILPLEICILDPLRYQIRSDLEVSMTEDATSDVEISINLS